MFGNPDLPDMSVLLQGNAVPPPVVLETGNEPSLEFLELREFYSREARAEGEMSGFVEYKQAKSARDWPGIDRIVTDVEARIKAGVFKTGYAPGLRRYLTERFWKAPIVPQARERPFPTESPNEVTAKNVNNFQRVLASMAGGEQ